MKTLSFVVLTFLLSAVTFSQTVEIAVDINQNRKNVSPYIYGKNNSLSDDPSAPLSTAEWNRLKDAGIKLFRECGGNNATKYNWRLKLTSAPDWYNMVYGANWDFEAQSLQQHIPGTKAMYAFQLIGKAAANDDHNFDDWGYNGAEWWPGTAQNLAGGGVVNPDWNATKALVEGDIDLYLTDWTADSTVGILDKWFGGGAGSLDLNETTFNYWNMDNEPEIWEGTHDDVMPHQPSAEEFMQRYFAVAKKAKAKFPNVKLVGFVPCSEWYWFAYPDGEGGSGKISYGGSEYTWVEFFIKRIAEEQTASGIRLLDVIDLHTYFDVSSEEELLQSHRIYYDQTYDYPHANGVKLLGASGWDNSITKEYIFKRINTWLTQYMGAGHNVTIGSTESGWEDFNQMPMALNYASTLGVFANEGVELFTPWMWSPSYWEVIHLFSNYSKNVSVKSTSNDDNNVSAYSTVSADNDSLTIVLVNRYSTSRKAQVSLANFAITDGIYNTYVLKELPEDNSTETFVSHSDNALVSSFAISVGNVVSVTLPAYSVTSVVLRTGAPAGYFLGVSPSEIDLSRDASVNDIEVYSNVNWTASSDQSWVTLNTTSGSNVATFTASVSENTTTIERTATITVSGTGVSSQTITISQDAQPVYATEDLIIYNDNETLIEATWEDQGTLAEINSGAFEGTKHYSFDYNFSNWWAGYGLNLTNWAGDGSGYDFTKYLSLIFACRVTGPVSVSISLIDADASHSSSDVTIDATSSYKQFIIPLSSFTGLDLNDVGEILINLSGNDASGSGTFEIDNIRLGISTASINENKNSAQKGYLENYPNPFSTFTNITFNAPAPDYYSLKILDIMGKEIAVLYNNKLIMGKYTVDWNGTNLNGEQVSSGVYLIQITSASGYFETGKILFSK